LTSWACLDVFRHFGRRRDSRALVLQDIEPFVVSIVVVVICVDIVEACFGEDRDSLLVKDNDEIEGGRLWVLITDGKDDAEGGNIVGMIDTSSVCIVLSILQQAW
jgi:hypothetical protein